MTHLNITLKDQVYHHFIFLSHDRGFINLSNYWVDNIHKSNDLSTILIIKIAFTFWRTIWRTHSVLPFIITTMMTIIFMSLHALIHIINHLSSFRLTFTATTFIWLNEASQQADFRVITFCYHILFKEWSKFNMTNFNTFHQNLSHHYFITMVHWLKLNVLSILGVLGQILWDLNPITVHQNSNWCLTLLVR